MTDYYPDADHWQHLDPAAAGFDDERLTDSFAYAITQEITTSQDLTQMIPTGQRHPYDRQLGPIKDRSTAAGLVAKNGYLIGQFGPVDSTEVTFSCSKSYLSATAGLAFDDGLIDDLDQPVAESVHDGGFDSPHNAQITWRQLLQQTSEWEGELFGLPDWIDRGRQVNSTPGMEAGTIGGSAAASGGDTAAASTGSASGAAGATTAAAATADALACASGGDGRGGGRAADDGPGAVQGHDPEPANEAASWAAS